MNWQDTQELVQETLAQTGAAPPEMLDENAPILADGVLADRAPGSSSESAGADDSMYIIGLIGGKEVGKSALVNALAGETITAQTSHGPGTEIVVAYAHQKRLPALKALLEKQVPGKYRLVPHENQRLSRQVLLDLPDIDSRFTDHVETTRRMLRHMLFPIWIQSVEKYADAQPQALLAKVAAGNDPGNFLFCLNKADQLPSAKAAPDHNGLAEQLRSDYAQRIARVLSLKLPPRVYMISATHPGEFDLPELSSLLSQEKSAQNVTESRQLAARQRQRSVLEWLSQQNLDERAARLARLEEESSEILSQRIGVPLVENIVPAILDDAAYRMVMTDGVFARRVARWPIVSVLHALIAPLRLFVRENAAPGTFFGGAQALVDSHLSAMKNPVAGLVQSAFAQLHQSSPSIATLYDRRKLWEASEAAAAEARLRERWIDTVNRQREILLSRLHGRAGIIAPFFRVLLTLGALLWFPFVQPLLAALLQPGSTILSNTRDAGIVLVQILSAPMLLHSAVFLIIWYFIIWALLRWDTRRSVDRLLWKWKSTKNADPELNLTTGALEWIDELLDPIGRSRHNMEDLANRAKALQEEMKV